MYMNMCWCEEEWGEKQARETVVISKNCLEELQIQMKIFPECLSVCVMWLLNFEN